MQQATIYNKGTATHPADDTLEAIERMIGFVPNVFGVMGATPHILAAFTELNTQFSKSSLSPAEREIVLLSVSVQNACGYCVAGHTAFAKFTDLPADEVAAIRTSVPMKNARYEALRQFAESLSKRNGHYCDAQFRAFCGAGYSEEQALDVVLGVSLKVFSNITANLFQLPLDEAFQTFHWSPPAGKCLAA